MATPNTNTAGWKERFVAEIKRDKKKTIVLGTLLLVAVVVFGRLLLGGDSPAPAGAAVKPTGTAVVATPTGIPPGNPTASLTSGRAKKSKRALVALDTRVTRDIFRPNPEYFPLHREKKHTAVDDTGSELDAKAKRVHTQASVLNLQSVIGGQKGAAIINGRVLRVGQHFSGFKVVEIRASSCVVEKDDVKVELKLAE